MWDNYGYYRDLFLGLDSYVELKNGKSVIPINFDNGATTPPFKLMEKYLQEFIPWYSSIGRGKGQKAKKCTEFYKKSRDKILSFFNINNKSKYTVVYVKNTTEGINLLSNILCNNKDEIVLSTRMEHHSNDLPWRSKCKVDYVEVDIDGSLKINEIEEKLIEYKGKIKYVTITGASNVTGYVNPINYIAKIVHKYGAKLIVDGAQLVAHKEIYMEGTEEDDYIDFLVFSAHKMYAPLGVGVVIGLKEVFSKAPPFMTGGGTVDVVLDDEVYWADCPEKDEAGTPNVLGVVALLAAIRQIEMIGFWYIENHERRLLRYFLDGLNTISDLTLYGAVDCRKRIAVIPFNSNKIWHEEMSELLADIRGISVRDGCFCAQPYAKRLLGISNEEAYKILSQPRAKRPGMVRASLGLYNSIDEINIFLNVLEYIQKKY